MGRRSSSRTSTKSRSSRASATSSASSCSSRTRSKSARLCGHSRCSSRRARSTSCNGERHEPASRRSVDPPRHLGEELRADHAEPVHVQGAQGRAQDAGPAGRRAAVRREGREGKQPQGAGQAEAARAYQGRPSRLEEGDRRAQGRRLDRDLRGGSALVPIRRYKPTSPGRRFMSVSTFEEITKSKPEKTLLTPVTKKGGRNNNGRITTPHHGADHNHPSR